MLVRPTCLVWIVFCVFLMANLALIDSIADSYVPLGFSSSTTYPIHAWDEVRKFVLECDGLDWFRDPNSNMDKLHRLRVDNGFKGGPYDASPFMFVDKHSHFHTFGNIARIIGLQVPTEYLPNGKLLLGEFAEDRIQDGSLVFTPLSSKAYSIIDQTYGWAIQFERISFGQKELKVDAIRPSTSGFPIVFPKTTEPELSKIFPRINVKEEESNSTGWFTPCTSRSNLPDLHLELKEGTLTLESKYFVDKRSTEGHCHVAFRFHEDDRVDLGVVWMRRFYTVFDAEQNRVGIGKLKSVVGSIENSFRVPLGDRLSGYKIGKNTRCNKDCFGLIPGDKFDMSHISSLLRDLLQQQEIPRIFGFSLGHSPEVFVGGVSSAQTGGELIYTDMASETYLVFDIESFGFGDRNSGSVLEAQFINTEEICLPEASLEYVKTVFPPVKDSEPNKNGWRTPCNNGSLPDLRLAIGWKSLRVPSVFFSETLEDGTCLVKFQFHDAFIIDLPLVVWGYNFYTVFDLESFRIGFAPLKPEPSTATKVPLTPLDNGTRFGAEREVGTPAKNGTSLCNDTTMKDPWKPSNTFKVPLRLFDNGARFGAELEVGTPAKKFLITLDTSMKDSWVPLMSFYGNDLNLSSSFELVDDIVSKDVADLALVETIRLGPRQFQQVPLIATISTVLPKASVGILGASFGALSHTSSPSLLQHVMLQQSLPRVLGLNLGLSESEGELVVGGYDHDHIRTDIVYMHVLSRSFWNMVYESFSVGSLELPNKFHLIVQSSHSHITFPAHLRSEMEEMFPRHQLRIADASDWFTPCNKAPVLQVEVGGYKCLTLHPKQYIRRRTSTGLCLLPFDFVEGNVVALGVPWLRHFYTVFDAEKSQVGFARLRTEVPHTMQLLVDQPSDPGASSRFLPSSLALSAVMMFLLLS